MASSYLDYAGLEKYNTKIKAELDKKISVGGVAWTDITGKPEIPTKDELTNVYKYKGSVANVAALPAADNTTGDVYNVEDTGMNYAWNGTEWDALGQILEISAITNEQIDALFATES